MEDDSSSINGGELCFSGESDGVMDGNGNGGKVLQGLQRSFGEVQGILDQNRLLIQEISQNHEARDADGLTRNVSLIRELNTNIGRIVDLYADLSYSFSRSVKNKGSSAAGGGKGHKRSRPE